MTQEELDALPEDGTFHSEIVAGADGVPVRQFRFVTVGALFAQEDEAHSVVDTTGQRWMVGWANGIRYKRRFRG